MLKTYKYPSPTADKFITRVRDRALKIPAKTHKSVERMMETVRRQGNQALIDFTRQFDAPKMKLSQLKVTKEEFKAAEKQVDRAFSRALNRAIRQITTFHEAQRQRSWMQTERPGVMLGQMVHPVQRAGVYVPGGMGGTTPLVSSVLMGALPARIAGVDEVVMVSPPCKDGTLNPHLLVAARKAGVDAVYKVGSAWAIAALAYGTESIPAVDVIVGPGNLYVTIAKKIVAGTVGIDMVAGPSEVLVIADDSANPEYAAADLLSQAEHDPMASAILVTTNPDLATAVDKAVAGQLESLSRREIAAQSLKRYGGALVVSSLDAAIDLANQLAPEHLELQIQKPFEVIGRLRTAGAIFVGNHTPEPMGDYIAGPNHVLPTAGTARFSSALSVSVFTKQTSLIHYGREAFEREAKDVITLAEIEGLGAHARSVKIRLES